MQTQSTNHNLVRLRIDNIKPKWVTCVWLFFFLLIGFLFLLVLAIPTGIFQYKYFPGNVCGNDVEQKDYCKPFDFETNPVQNIVLTNMAQKNQYLVIDIKPILFDNVTSPRQITDDIEFNLTIYELSDDLDIDDKPIYENFHHLITFTCYIENYLVPLRACDNRTIVYLPQVDEENYLFRFTFMPQQSLKDKVRRFDAYITTINPDYTDFQLALRYTCLGLTLIFLFLYWRSLRKMRGEKVVFEQKFIKWLGIFLIFFNDPIYAATILQPGLFVAVISSFFITTFACALLLFWICAFERVYKENTQVKTRTLTWMKMIYIFFLWLFTVVAYNILNREYLKDPSFDFNDEYKDSFKAFKILMIIFIAIGLGWLFYGFSQVLRKYNTIIWRHKMFFSFSTYFIFCYFVFLFTGSLSVYSMNGTKTMLLFGISNTYIWFLMLLYTKSGGVFHGSEQPITLSEGMKEYQGYEHLDESARHDDFNINGLSGPSNKEGQEAHDPDQIIFQIDNNGNLFSANNNNNNNNNRNQAYQPRNDFDNFGHGGNNAFGGNNNHNNANAQEEDNQGTNKYPFEIANDDI